MGGFFWGGGGLHMLLTAHLPDGSRDVQASDCMAKR